MQARFLTNLALSCLLASCGSGEAPDPCAARLDALESRLRAAAAVAEPAGAPPGIALPRADTGGTLDEALPLLVVTGHDVRFEGRGVGGVGDPVRTAETLMTDLRRRLAHQRASVALWVDPEVPLERLVELLRGTPRGIGFVVLVRGDETRGERSAGSEAELGRPIERRERMESAWTEASAGCGAAAPHLPLPSSMIAPGLPLGPPSIAPLMVALRECGCGSVDHTAVEAVVTDALVSPDGPTLRLPGVVQFGPGRADISELALEGGTTMQGVVNRLARDPSERVAIRVQ